MAIFELGEFLELHCKDFKHPLNAVILASAIYEDEPDANVYYIAMVNYLGLLILIVHVLLRNLVINS